jgi:hypothetical protein
MSFLSFLNLGRLCRVWGLTLGFPQRPPESTVDPRSCLRYLWTRTGGEELTIPGGPTVCGHTVILLTPSNPLKEGHNLVPSQVRGEGLESQGIWSG